MKNVLQLIGSFHQGGSERQAVQLTRLLCEDQTHKVFVAALSSEGILKSEIERLGFRDIPEFRLTSFFDPNFFRQLKKFVVFLRENKIEVVQTHDFYTNIFGIAAARIAGIPLKIASKRETGGMRTPAQKFIENRIFSLADAIVVNSEAVKNYLKTENVRAAKIKTVYNGLDLQRLAAPTADRKNICAELGLPVGENIKFMTLVANLRHAVKNQPMFLRVAQKISKDFPHAHFVLAGEGDLKNGLQNLARELKIEKNLHLIGRCTKVPELLSISYAGVLTSFHEGFSNAILEYMAAGKPVVATDVGGADEAIIEGETGFIVESNDDDKMAQRLSELLADAEKAAAFGARGLQIAAEKFSLNAQLQKTLALYEKNGR